MWVHEEHWELQVQVVKIMHIHMNTKYLNKYFWELREHRELAVHLFGYFWNIGNMCTQNIRRQDLPAVDPVSPLQNIRRQVCQRKNCAGPW